jgi:hypothetical protein
MPNLHEFHTPKPKVGALSVHGFLHNKTKPTTQTLLPEISLVTFNVYLYYANVKAGSVWTHAILTS